MGFWIIFPVVTVPVCRQFYGEPAHHGRGNASYPRCNKHCEHEAFYRACKPRRNSLNAFFFQFRLITQPEHTAQRIKKKRGDDAADHDGKDQTVQPVFHFHGPPLSLSICYYLQTFCHRPFTCLYSHLDVPRGGRPMAGNGLSSVGGSGFSGSISTDGKSSVLSHM